MRVEAIAGARRSTGTGARTWRQWLGVWALWTVLAAVGGIAGGAVTWSWATEVHRAWLRGGGPDRRGGRGAGAGRAGDRRCCRSRRRAGRMAAPPPLGGSRRPVDRGHGRRAGRRLVLGADRRLAVERAWSLAATGSGAAGILGLDVGGLVGGSAVGLSQWIVLRRWVARSSLWIAASAVGGAAGIGLSQYVAQAAAGGVVAGGLAWVGAVAVAAAGVGAVTGVALVLLLAPPHNRARQPAARRPDRLRRAAPAVVTVLLVSVGLVVPSLVLRRRGAIRSHPAGAHPPVPNALGGGRREPPAPRSSSPAAWSWTSVVGARTWSRARRWTSTIRRPGRGRPPSCLARAA